MRSLVSRLLLVVPFACGGADLEDGTESADAGSEHGTEDSGDGDGDGDGDPSCFAPFEARPTPSLDLSAWVDGEMELVGVMCSVSAVTAGAEDATRVDIECPFEDTTGTIGMTVSGSPSLSVGHSVEATGNCQYVGGDAEPVRPRGYDWKLTLRDEQGALLVAAADGSLGAGDFDPLAMQLASACGEPTQTEDARAAVHVTAPDDEALLFPGDTRVFSGLEVHVHRAELIGCCEVGSWVTVTVLPQ